MASMRQRKAAKVRRICKPRQMKIQIRLRFPKEWSIIPPGKCNVKVQSAKAQNGVLRLTYLYHHPEEAAKCIVLTSPTKL